MKIAVIGHIRHPIAAPFQGGMEAHCHQLVARLARAGHEVTLLAAAGSDSAFLSPICDAPYEAVLPWQDWRGTDRLQRFQQQAFARAWRIVEAGQFDVVHNNALYPALIDWAIRDVQPMVSSQHVPPFGAMREAVARARDVLSQVITVTSVAQLGCWEGERGTNMHVVPNGIDLEHWHGRENTADYLLWAGRIVPNKGLREAVLAARKAEMPLKIIGPLEDRTYFAEAVEPLLTTDIRYEGLLSGDALEGAIAAALAMIVTPMWDEPFGLVAAEAMACGVPVIAFDRGALPEVLGDCGALVPAADIDALARAMARANELERAPCRERIARFFSIEKMIAGYESCYLKAISGAAVERMRGSRPADSSSAAARFSSQSSKIALSA